MGDYLRVQRLTLDLHGLQVHLLIARSPRADLATGDLSLSCLDVSGVVTRLWSNGGGLTVGPAPGSNQQQAQLRITGTWGGRSIDTTGSLLAQGKDIEILVPALGKGSFDWPVSLPMGAGFDAATSTPTGVDVHLTGHQVVLGSSIYEPSGPPPKPVGALRGRVRCRG